MPMMNHAGVVITIPKEGVCAALLKFDDQEYSLKGLRGEQFDQFKLRCESCAQELMHMLSDIQNAELSCRQAELQADQIKRNADRMVKQAHKACEAAQEELDERVKAWKGGKEA